MCTLLGYNKFKLNKIGVYIMKQNKKLTWLQACFLGDVRVIWYSSLGDSHFQTYVMNFVEIVIDYYLHLSPHMYLMLLLVAYTTQVILC